MKSIHFAAVLFAASLLPVWAEPLITEFCASNQNGLSDEDGNESDWIEIYNPDATPAVLTNWYLSDTASNKTKWQFPTTTLAPNSYLVVFASSKDRRISGAQLHTNFSLSGSGEYLGLTKPDGTTVVSQYSPTFPAQLTDVTYGIPSNVSTLTLVAENAACHWIFPTSASSPATTWKNVSFTPAGWNSATMGIGYDKDTAGTNFTPFIGSNGNIQAAETAANNASCYVRIPFNVTAGTTISSLKLRVRYDDGFAAYLNGQPLLSGGVALKRNAPTTLAWNSVATATVNDAAAATYVDFDISENIGSLVSGSNVLAFQSLNNNVNTTDQLLQVILTGDVATQGSSSTAGYFSVATPGARNPDASGMIIPQVVAFSKNSGTFSSNFSLTLSGAAAGQVIRYTLDGSEPTAASSLYSSALSISATRVVRARIYDSTTGAAGAVSGVHYEKLDTTLSSYASTGAVFKSALPIVVLNDNGIGEIANDNVARDTRIQIFDRAADGYATLSTSTPPTQSLFSGVKLRGRSSAGFAKKSYGIEIHTEAGAEKNVSLLGMPASEDWALVGGYDFDRASMRNAWIYEVSRQAGRWAPRTRLVEVYFNQDGDNLEYADYRGVYILCEAIRTGSDRVDVAKLDTSDVTQPDVSGGYIFKVDAPESDEFSWQTTNPALPQSIDGQKLVIHRPKLASLAAAQTSYLQNYFQAFQNAAFAEASSGFTTRNYRNYIDSESWADHNLFCTLAKNVDALRLSAYYHKDRSGKMMGGPLWDFDRSANSTDGRDDATNTWYGTSDATNYHTYAWWAPLFQDVEFCQVYVDRWAALRRGSLATTNVNAILDGYLAEYKTGDADNPSTRDHAKWYGGAAVSPVGAETTALKSWLQTRSEWIDSQFTGIPVITRASGVLPNNQQTTTISVPSGTVVYFTANGTDPRAEGGGVAPGASQYSGAISLPNTMRLRARAFRSGTFAIPATNWSAPAEALYLLNEPYATSAEVRVSAVNYHPLAPTAAESAAVPNLNASDFEWIELCNVSSGTVNLQGISLPKDLPVSPLTLPAYSLPAGERVIIAKNAQAFTLRYGAAAAAKIVATWTGHYSLDDGGGEIHFLDHLGATLAHFEYDDSDSWPTRADGEGSSLIYIGSSSLQTDYENAANWKSSTAVHGTPGFADSTRSTVVINEVVSNSSPSPDAIELFNTGAAAVNIGGWYLSNNIGASTETDYRQYRIPNNTLLPAGGYLVFTEANFNPTPLTPAATDFSLDGPRGGTVWLIAADQATGKFATFEQKESFTPVSPNVSYGRAPNGTGDLVPLAATTLGAPNSAARVGPVQVSEIHYYPSGTTPEFVEISNTSATSQSLERWTLRGDVDFDFPLGFTIGPAEAIVMVSFNPIASPALESAFRSQYGVGTGVRLLGPWSASDTLSNTAGTVRLKRRVPAPVDELNYIGLMVEDEVNYLSTVPWPATASGTGSSIHRLGVLSQGSDPTSWIAQAPDPGSGVNGYAAWQLGNFNGSPNGAATLDIDRDGLPNLVEYLTGNDPNVRNPLAIIRLPGGGFALDYTLRKDRDDAVLVAERSIDLQNWSPAEDDSVQGSIGTSEQHHVVLPAGSKNFLRLKGTSKPAAP